MDPEMLKQLYAPDKEFFEKISPYFDRDMCFQLDISQYLHPNRDYRQNYDRIFGKKGYSD